MVDRSTSGLELTREGCIAGLERLEELRTYEQATEVEVAALEAATARLQDAELVWRVRLLRALLVARGGDLAQAIDLLHQVLAHAAGQDDRRLVARTHLVLAWTHRDLGDHSAYLEHAAMAVETLDDQTPLGILAMHLIRLADALVECDSMDEARTYYARAEDVAVRAGDLNRLISALNNRAYGEYLVGDVEGAWTTITRLLDVSARNDVAVRPSTLDTLARIQIARGEHDEARETVRRALAVVSPPGHGENRAPVELLLTLAVALRHCRSFCEAERALDEARGIAESGSIASMLAQIDREQAQLNAAQGNFQQAYAFLQASHDAEKALLSERRASQVRLRQAVLRTAQAQATAERFRDEALHDPLTGLPNRRQLDQQLPGLISASRHTSVATALIDLDHFKAVNDAYSHVVGDAVLVGVAAQIEASAAEWRATGRRATAARLGGEEFLLVLADSPDAAAQLHHLEKLRLAIAAHDWNGVAPTLQVTMSAGVTWMRADDTQAALLTRADEQMYAAKRAGRNRIRHLPDATAAPRAQSWT